MQIFLSQPFLVHPFDLDAPFLFFPHLTFLFEYGSSTNYKNDVFFLLDLFGRKKKRPLLLFLDLEKKPLPLVNLNRSEGRQFRYEKKTRGDGVKKRKGYPPFLGGKISRLDVKQAIFIPKRVDTT